MAEEYADRDVSFAFLYTREAHPAERRPAHVSIDDKITAAKAMIARWGMRRPMLVDALDGPIHGAYGLLPNMTWIVDRRGGIVYKASWTDERTIRMALDQALHEREEAASGHRMLPYQVEWQPSRISDREPFLRGLAENGPRAVEEYIAAVEHNWGAPMGRKLRAMWAEIAPEGS